MWDTLINFWNMGIQSFLIFGDNSSLQCYSVLSAIAQVLRKMKLKNLISEFLMSYLSETLKSFQRVKICPYGVNNIDFINTLQ